MILITGSLAFDQILDFPGKFSDHIMPDKIHKLNVSFLVEKMRRGFGGTAGNISYTMALLGTHVSVMGIVGEDFGPYLSFLKNSGVDVSYLRSASGLYTSTAIGFTDKTDNHIWGFHTGADTFSDNLSPSEVREKIEFGVIAPHNPEAMLKFASEYSRKNIPYLFDPGMQLPYFSGDQLLAAFKGARIIIGNDYEISVMEKKTGIVNLHSLSGEGKIIITTFGGKGSMVTENGRECHIPVARTREVNDPAGAGDCYRAGFLSGYLRSRDMETCGRMGAVAAAYTVEEYGTTTHKFTIAEFKARYRENFGKELKI